jgi:long-subunit fatty acid transport protein
MPLLSADRFLKRPARAAGGSAWLALLLCAASRAAGQEILRDTDRIDITGRQNLTLGSGARAYGMGGAFLARADDATAASWNPAGLSYLRVPEVSLVGVSNSFDATRGSDYDRFDGQAFDFAAFTWPVGFGEVRGAVQLSYQRAISFDGSRSIRYSGETQSFTESGGSDGGFDVVAFGTGLRLSRKVRAGFTVNRWLNGYDQTLTRSYETFNRRPRREYDLDFRPRGWSFNLGLIVSPIESLNVAVVYKTPFHADVGLEKERRDYWTSEEGAGEVTKNAFASDATRLEFPSSYGIGLSWRPIDTVTLSADFTRTTWSAARIRDYFEIAATPESTVAGPGAPPPPTVYPNLQYPTLRQVPTSDDPEDPVRLAGQQDADQIRLGVEWVLIAKRVKVPLRGGYFNDRQIIPNLDGDVPRFNGFTAGTGLILGPILLDVAFVYEFGEYTVTTPSAGGAEFDQPVPATTQVRNSLTTKRFYASMIYRFRGSWRP